MQVEPLPQHQWLNQFLGDWTVEWECRMGPDQPPSKSSGHESVRALGSLWILCESQIEVAEGCLGTNVITLGFDPGRQRFVGSFISSMTADLWLYDGVLDASEKVLTLDTEGPKFDGSGGRAKYQDIFTIVSENERRLTSRILGDDGNWTEFMNGVSRRR